MAISNSPQDSNDDYDANARRPRVAIPNQGFALPLAVIAALGLGGVVFWQLSQGRERADQALLTDPINDPTAVISTQGVPPPPVFSQPDPMAEPAPPVIEQPPLLMAADPMPSAAPSVTVLDREARLKAPSLVVDLSELGEAAGTGATGNPLAAAAVSQALSPRGAGTAAAPINNDELFAQRLGVGDSQSPAVARAMTNPSQTVPEGAVIPAVLETAINSDLPGYTRAVVSRDVRGFNGQSVLIPRGSRLIGQYRSGVALGQSRAFVIWTRLIRPDGATIELAAPGADALGRGGLQGEVDRHFLQRFGGSILLSLIDAGVSAANDDSNTQVIISQSRALSQSTLAPLTDSMNISPTITVPQGAPIRIIVTRDLDFSQVGPMNE
jgi:type IV secretion system protein VirB10